MSEWHMKSKRKPSGGLRNTVNRTDKKLAWKGGIATLTTISASEKEASSDVSRVKGGISKIRAKTVHYVVVSVKNKAKKGKIASVVENKGNRQYARRNIITKGAIVKAEVDGKEEFVKITSRPGQTGAVFGVLTDWKPEETKSKKAKEAAGKKEKHEKPSVEETDSKKPEKAEKTHKKPKKE